MKKFEYIWLKNNPWAGESDAYDSLNAAGLDGWEAIGMESGYNGSVLMKRELREVIQVEDSKAFDAQFK